MKRLCQCGHGPLYHFQKAGACHARLEEGAGCPCQAFRSPSDEPQAPTAVDHEDVGFRHSPPSKVARGFWLGFLALLFLVLWMLTGCASGRHLELPPAPQDAAQKASCAPLPACDIPPGANSTQLELALWKCVLDYRAMYSVCFHMVNAERPTP